jgi:hypothetical protein
MALASYHVLRGIVEIVERGDMGELQDVCAKFCERYPNDRELHKITCEVDSKISEYLITKDEKLLDDVKAELTRLINIRKMETTGGDRLWYKDRRH